MLKTQSYARTSHTEMVRSQDQGGTMDDIFQGLSDFMLVGNRHWHYEVEKGAHYL